MHMYKAHTLYSNFFITLLDCMDLYIYEGNSTGNEFKLIRPILCPSVLLAIKGQKDKLPHTHSWGFLFVGCFTVK